MASQFTDTASRGEVWSLFPKHFCSPRDWDLKNNGKYGVRFGEVASYSSYYCSNSCKCTEYRTHLLSTILMYSQFLFKRIVPIRRDRVSYVIFYGCLLLELWERRARHVEPPSNKEIAARLVHWRFASPL